MKLSKYPSYKDSGVEWLGMIPEHWEPIRMKHLFKDHSKKNSPNEELLSVTQDKGVVPRSLVENRMVMPSGALETFKYIQKGDFAISLRSFEGGLEYSEYNGIISPAYTVLRAKRNVIDSYFKYLFKSFSFISELQTAVVGIRQGKNISYAELSYSFLPTPSPIEQQRIADYLELMTAKIDTAIAQKERMIELLQERKQILINQAVTTGLDPNVELKDSGVDYIGQIPEHWDMRKLKYSADLISKKILSKGSELPYVGMENIESGTGKFIESSSETEGLSSYFKKDDILFGKLRPYLAKVYLAENKGICSTEFLVYRPKDIISGKFLKLIMLSTHFIQQIDSSTYGSKMPRANPDYINNQLIAIPPISEQLEIVEYVETYSIKIDKTIIPQQIIIEKLKEYKVTLIDSAVTGKICIPE